jgi:hypothetical protein
VIFHSHVSLPEGMCAILCHGQVSLMINPDQSLGG